MTVRRTLQQIHIPWSHTSLAAALLLTFLFVLSVYTPEASAFTGGLPEGAAAAKGEEQPTELFGEIGIFSKITNVLLFIVGAVSVLMIIIGGLRYVLSGGDSAKVSGAKNTILYAIVGVIIAILAFAIINFVLGSFTEGGSTGGGGGFETGGSGGRNATDF
jgi:ABC-type Fe3+ transport system permease subunit